MWLWLWCRGWGCVVRPEEGVVGGWGGGGGGGRELERVEVGRVGPPRTCARLLI